MAEEQQAYYPPTAQPYQYQIMIYQANGLIGHRLLQYFRNDHLVEVNPNIMVGTINPRLQYRNQLDLDHVIDNNNQLLLNSAIASSDIIIFPLHQHNTQDLEYLLKFVKCWRGQQKKKVIVISSIFTWKARANHKTIRKEDYPTRIAINSTVKDLENLCLGLNNLNPDATGCVISSGLVYGMGEDALFYQFKQALQQKDPLKIYGRGINHIPTIHVDDLAQLAFDMAFSTPDSFQFGVDYSQVSQREIVQAISKTIGNGETAEVPIEDGFLQPNFDIFSGDILIDQSSLPTMSNWKCKSGLINNMGLVVGEFNSSRGLKPNKILIHGTPASGKSKLAEILSKNYGLPVLTINQLIEDIKNQESEFANQIKALLQELKATKIEEQRKAYEELKKKKKGKGVDEFDPSKVVPRLDEKDVCRILKRRINMADCLNKGYIIDGVVKSYAACQAIFNDENNQPLESILPNSVFSLEATEQQTKERIKKLTAEVTQGTHWNEQQTIRRFNVYKQQNEPKKWSSFFENLVEIKKVPFDYTESNQFIQFIQRNGPLGFKVKPAEENNQAELPQEQKVEDSKQAQPEKEEEEENQFEEEAFDIEKLTENETKILNEKSRPIRQYLIDNVIPQITEGLLEICKQTPPDPIKYLINFLQTKKTRKRKVVKA